jgi:polar amino acid transport system substrate-binding protein
MSKLVLSSSGVARHTSDPRVADLVRASKIRVGLFPPQYTKDPASGDLRGVWVEVVRALGARIGVEVVILERPTPSEVVDALNDGACDIASLGFDPSRASDVGGFSPPFMRVDYTYLLPVGSPIQSVANADRPGVRIAAVRNHASTLALSGKLKHAEQMSVETADTAFDLLRRGQADAWASIRPVLLDYSSRLSGSRVLIEGYGANLPALVVAKGQSARLAFISEFIEEAKASGLVQRAIERAGQAGYQVAPKYEFMGTVDAFMPGSTDR